MARRSEQRRNQFTIAIVGGGFTGAALAAQLLGRGDAWLRVVVIERGGSLGRGVAYGTLYNWHLLNVPAGKMSMLPDQPEHFLRWAQRNYERMVAGDSFVPRRVYGQYVGAVLRETEIASPARLQWHRDEAEAVRPGLEGTEILLRSGERIIADRVVLALGNLPPSDPLLSGLTEGSARYVSYPWSAKALEAVDQVKAVLLIGSGLTAVDLALALRSREFKGVIHILSRRGLPPHRHKVGPIWPPFWNHESPRTARGLLRLVREQVRLAAGQGYNWRSVIDALRPVTPEIWQSLPPTEKRRFLRHVRAHWEVRRHRLAPEVAKLFAYQLMEGKVRVHAGRILTCREAENRVEVSLRERKRQAVESIVADRVINCTGPETDFRKLEDVLLADLQKQGLVRPDPWLLGLDVAANGAAVDREGRASEFLFVLGPARKGQLWETTAVPEIRDQVAELAMQFLPDPLPPVRLQSNAGAEESVPGETQQV